MQPSPPGLDQLIKIIDPEEFSDTLQRHLLPPLHAGPVQTLQINMGLLCNMTCRHCHVDAGPTRIVENMSRETMHACLSFIDTARIQTVDITGGAPELNPNFRELVESCRQRDVHVMDRCNLTVLLLPRHKALPEWLAQHEVELICSLPHFRKRGTDRQRGDGTFQRSIEALKRLNQVGYGKGDPTRKLTLMHNPAGAFFGADPTEMETRWRTELGDKYGVTFDHLICLNNMPINRFLDWLIQSDNLGPYLRNLVNAFNPGTVAGLMCKDTLSIDWNGRVYDCDFNQMLNIPAKRTDGSHISIFELISKESNGNLSRPVMVGPHCFGCTAGRGSSCGGATTPIE